MNKVAIVTLHGYSNYGNKLQNYALQEVIKKLGFDVETINFNVLELNKRSSIFVKIKTALLNPKKIFDFINRQRLNFRLNFLYKKLINEKISRFKEFSVNFLNEKCYELSLSELDKINDLYSYFISGSDQVWNPLYINEYFKYYLTFAEKSKSISYAASFAVPEVSDEISFRIKPWLEDFNYISVREIEGQRIVKAITNLDVPVLVDPTLLIDKEHWIDLARVHEHKPKNKYILTYFLGKDNKTAFKRINLIAKESGFDIVRLGDLKAKIFYAADPSEFIDYFNDAEIIFTDSFHGAVFSILFNRPFVVFKRGNMNSRIDTLLSKFKLEDRHWDYVKEHENYFDIDYSHVDAILEEEREKSFNYLKKALGLKKEE